MENNPRVVFERLFGDTGSTRSLGPARAAAAGRQPARLGHRTGRGPAARARRAAIARSSINTSTAIRDVERRIQKAEEQSTRELPVIEQPAGVPATFGEHVRLMFDLQLLAYQTDLTRVVTFMLGREITGRTYAEIGVPDAHHPISHHQRDPEKFAKLTKINTYHVSLFAEFLEKLRQTPDGDGSLLDHVTLIYGAGMADSNSHGSKNLPIVLVGGGTKGGRHLKYAEETPFANLHLTLMDRMGVQIDQLGHSTGRLPLEPLAGV